MTSPPTPVLVTAVELADALAGRQPPVVLDVRWRLGGPPGRGEYLAGHVPGAVYVDLDSELSRPGDPPTDATTPVAAYCGSGVTAAHELAALAIAGIDATLLPGLLVAVEQPRAARRDRRGRLTESSGPCHRPVS